MATRFKPDEAVERQILAELYEATDQTEAAVGEHALVLQKDPLRVDPVPEPLQAVPPDARVRPRVVHVRGARVSPQDRRGRAALLRGLPPARDDPGEEPPRQRGLGQEPVPQGREPLHRQDLRDADARGHRREDQPAARAEAAPRPRPAVPAGPGHEHGHVRQDVRVGGAGPRRHDARALRPQRRAGRAHGRPRHAAGQRRRADRAHGVHPAGAHVHRRQAPLGVPRGALHQEPVPDAQRAEGHPLRRREDRHAGLHGSGRDGAGRQRHGLGARQAHACRCSASR